MRYPETQVREPLDFEPRRRFPTSIQFGLSFFILYVILVSYFALSIDTIGFSVWSFVIVGVIAAFVTYTVTYTRDLLLATEFQNAIFASALGTNYAFSIIARKDGSIIFADKGLQSFMPGYSRMRHTYLEDIFELGNVPREQQQAVLDSIAYEQKESILISMSITGEEPMEMVFSVDPLVNPGSFILIRARRYSNERGKADAEKTETQEKQEKQLQTLAENLPVGIFYADLEGNLVLVNDLLESWLGYPAGHFKQGGYKLDTLVDNPADTFGGGKYRGEVRLRRQGGSYGNYMIAAHIEENVAGLPLMSAVVYAEAEEPRTVEVPVPQPAAETQATQYQASSQPVVTQEVESDGLVDLFEEAPIAIVRCNNEGQIIHVNKSFDELIQLDDTPRPQHILDLIVADRRDEVSQALSDLLDRNSDVQHVDVEFKLPDNQSVSVSIFANESTQNNVVTFYLIDVSEQKNLELRFAHSQKMQAVGQLAGGVAHDFNNLLTAMIGFCDLLLMRHPAGDQSFADIMQIKQNANRAANLVRQLLAFSRRQTLQAKNLDITEVLAELSNLIRRLIGENIELKMIHGRDLSMVKADQGQLEQVIINLAVNARDAMKDGGTLTIRSSNITIDDNHPVPKEMMAPAGEDGTIPGGQYVMVEVTDTGTGIPPDVVAKIFEPFFSTKEIGSGTGLGLSTVYGIIKQTGGYIFVNSIEGKGTQFHIYFPALSAEEERVADEEVQEQEAQDLTGRETILLVEDETPVRAFASRALKNKGYTVLEADCAEAAIELVRDHGSKLDLIVTDVIMPGMNGPTMVEQISKDFPNIKVVFMSGYAEDVFVSSYGSERSFNFLAKPFTLKQLAAKVKEILSS